jgi:long-chain acyl-CoA synthetase
MVARSPAHNLATLLLRSARRFPGLPAIAVGSGVRHSYGALGARVTRLAGALVGAGFRVGDRAALVASNCAEYVEALFACWHAGLCAVPINSKLHPLELGYVLQHAGARWAFADAACAATLGTAAREAPALEQIVEFGGDDYARLLGGAARDSPEAVARADPAWLFYTSGTTGRPKGAVLSHGNLQAMCLCFLADVETVAPGDAILHAAPLSHGSGLYALPHVLNAAVNVVPESGGFDPAEIVALLTRWPNACLFAAPTMVKRLIKHSALGGPPLAHLKSVVCGGAPMYVEDCRAAWAVLGPRLTQIYGQGESPMTITALSRALLADAIARDDVARLASVGTAQTGIEIRIVAADGAELPVAGTGEVCVRGPTVMQGYWADPVATALALADGWLHTGDIGSLDADGFLTLKDRAKDLIISGGSNIYPREIEEVLQKHPAVAETAVVGRRHADWGEEVVACVVAGAGADTATLEPELDALCLEHIARFKRPKAYVFMTELPKNNTGKVLKTVLRERVTQCARGSG